MVLSGARDDGAAGLTEIVKQGGQAVVQDPDEALHRSMPACALEQVPSVHVLPVAKIGTSLGELVGQGAAPITHNPVNPHLAAENEITMLEHKTTDELQAARPLSFSCPSCGGVLFELNGKPAPRFRCRVGHAWSPGSLVAEQTITVGRGAVGGVAGARGNAALHRRLAKAAEQHQRHRAAALYRDKYENGNAEARHLREVIARISIGIEDPQ